MSPGLWREVWILLTLALVAFALGAAFDLPFVFAALGFGLYAALHLRHLRDLHRWLTHRDRHEIPDAEGLWGDAFNEIRKLVKRGERREDQLAGMLERFQSAASAMPDAVIIVSQRDKIEWANPFAGHFLGINFPRDAGLRLQSFLRSPEFARYFEHADFAEPLEMVSPAHPERTVALQITPFGASQKLIIGRDITRLTKLEQMRRIFVANVSHELRTPVTVLTGYVETLSDAADLPAAELKRHLATMHEQAVRMQRLVDDLLMLSKLETAPPHRYEDKVEVPTLIEELKKQGELLSGAQKHKITLEVDTTLWLLGSREELASAFSNLVNNAVRYAPAGGAIALRWHADEGGAKFSVSDTGEGIAPEHIPHLTERFYRVDSARSRASGGTGLGLSIVKHVLMRHDARLDVESELGRGSTFICVFPPNRIVRA